MKQEVDSLKQALEKSGNSGKFLVSIERISPSAQCRQTFNESIIKRRMRSLQQEGQLDPLVLIPLDEEQSAFIIEDGEVTWRAATNLFNQGQLQWQQLQAVLSNADSVEAVHYRTLLHHLHSESLNPLDRAESVLKEIEIQYQIESERAVKLLRNITYRMRRNKALFQAISLFMEDGVDNSIISESLRQEQIALLALVAKLQLELVTFVNNDLSMLGLAVELKQAIRERELSCYHALAINKLDGKNLPLTEQEIVEVRQEVIDYVLVNQPSVAQTRRKVGEIVARYVSDAGSVSKSENNSTYQTIKTSFEQLSIPTLSSRQLKSLRKNLELQLTKIDRALSK